MYYTNEGCFNGCGRDFIHQIDSDHSEAQENAGLESDASSTVWRQIETGDIHHHEEDAGDEQTYHVQQGAPADQHLQRETECLGSNALWVIFISSLAIRKREKKSALGAV